MCFIMLGNIIFIRKFMIFQYPTLNILDDMVTIMYKI